MPRLEEREHSLTDGPAPGAFSALLRELVRSPEEEEGAPAWDAALWPGAVVGRFELVREVGRGGFGVVWEARDRVLGRTVAFKALHAGGSPELREDRLLREAEAAARLSHPNIVTLYDLGRSEHGPYLVLELLRGETLARRLERGPLAAREALRVAIEVAKGLAHAHAHGVVHRDLTPGNVFLCDDGQVKVLDLGMAHAFGRSRLEGGTPTCMAPEQWRGAPEDERTDVFALGALSFRMLTGDAPFPADGGRWVSKGDPAPRLDVPEQPALGAIVGRMLARDPVERPRDAAAALAELTAVQEVWPREPRHVAPVRARPRSRRRWWRRSLSLWPSRSRCIGGAALRGPWRPPSRYWASPTSARSGTRSGSRTGWRKSSGTRSRTSRGCTWRGGPPPTRSRAAAAT